VALRRGSKLPERVLQLDALSFCLRGDQYREAGLCRAVIDFSGDGGITRKRSQRVCVHEKMDSRQLDARARWRGV